MIVPKQPHQDSAHRQRHAGERLAPASSSGEKVDSWTWGANVTDAGEALLRHVESGRIHGLVDLKPESLPQSTVNGGPV